MTEQHPDQTQAILQQRALYYSQTQTQKGTPHEVIAFTRAQNRYAIPVSDFREIRPLMHFRRIPKASPIVPGVLAHRSEILSVHDLGSFLSKLPKNQVPNRETDRETGRETDRDAEQIAAWVLIVELHDRRYALLADTVFAVEEHDLDTIRPTPLTLTEWGPVFKGILGQETLLLDTTELFNNPRFSLAF